MDFPTHIDTMSIGLPIVYFKGSGYNFLYKGVFLSLKVVLILANSADPDEMQHLGLHCLPKYLFGVFQYTRG